MNRSIVIFGYDDRLLQSRRWVLETHGYTVETTSQFKETREILGAEGVDVMILCHTLSGEDFERALALASGTHPMPGVLVLDSHQAKRKVADGIAVLSDFPTSAALLAAVASVAGPGDGASL